MKSSSGNTLSTAEYLFEGLLKLRAEQTNLFDLWQ